MYLTLSEYKIVVLYYCVDSSYGIVFKYERNVRNELDYGVRVFVIWNV